jgi:hypothetical protein
MLRVKINSQIIDLPNDIAIQVKATNPIFTESGFNETYSYSFSIPKTAKNKNIISGLKNRYMNISIEFGSYLVESGIGSVLTNINSYSISFKNNGIFLRQKLENLQLNKLELEDVNVCDAADSPAVKLTKWQEHMTQTTITDPVDQGSHKFPQIQAFDDTQNARYFTDWFAKNPDYSFYVNRYASGEFLKNVGWPVAYNSSQPAWWTTVSPCVRIQYLFDQTLEFLQIDRNIDELADIEEFKQMIHYSLLALDKVETSGGNNFNVHGTGFSLSKFVPQKTGLDLFKMLDEQFALYYNYRAGKLNILLKKNIVSSKAIDVSKYCDPLFEIEETEGKSYTLAYPIDLALIDRFQNLIWEYSIATDSGTETRITHNTRKVGASDDNEEITLSYIPFVSRIISVDNIYPAVYNGLLVPELSMHTVLYVPFEQISKYYDEQKFHNEGGSTEFIIGLLRGIYSLYNSTTATWNDRAIFYNLHEFDPAVTTDLVNYQFGTCSLYLTTEKSHIDVYVKKYIDLLRRADLISKLLYLPIHKIIEIMKWEEPNHIIKQRNLSFKGTVKEINFTLYLDRVSPVSVTYAVSRSEDAGDFNQDYNEDYSI